MDRIWKLAGIVFCVLILTMPFGEGKKKEPEPPRILYIPHDNRPISEKQTVEAVEKLGFEVLVPPEELLGNRTEWGKPDALWTWLQNHAKEADAAVISSDAMLYGSLVGSRKHDYKKDVVLKRVDNFRELRKKYPKLPVYVFSSLMRTPRNSAASGHEEPGYYQYYGSDIFRFSELRDKREVEGLSFREERELAFLEKLLPKSDMKDWLGRREKNLAANKKLMDCARKNVFNYFLLGRDDNAPYSQTHMESRHLADYGKDMGSSYYQSMAGIDEIGILLLARAVNDMSRETPYVFVRYNWGRGPYTVPAYSDEPLSESVEEAIIAAGGMQTSNPNNADLVLTVNTNPNGMTYEAGTWGNDGLPREGTVYFVDIVQEYLEKGYPVGVADIAFANGSDNALMEELKRRNMLFKLQCYAGWNTPTNSTGFAIGEGILARHMKPEAVDDLLLTRYLDDWAYQANVRNSMARQLSWLRGDGVYGSLDGKRPAVMHRTDRLLKTFVENNFPHMKALEELHVSFPWNRLFESDIEREELDEKSLHVLKR